jgi:hypothetical protein
MLIVIHWKRAHVPQRNDLTARSFVKTTNVLLAQTLMSGVVGHKE